MLLRNFEWPWETTKTSCGELVSQFAKTFPHGGSLSCETVRFFWNNSYTQVFSIVPALVPRLKLEKRLMKLVTLCAIAATMAGSALLSTGAMAQATSPNTSVSQPASDAAAPVKAKAKKKQHVAAVHKKKKKAAKKPAADTQMDSSPMSSPTAPPASGGGM
ncbi:hypothetical protein PY365_04625 [Roseiarcaceae bacterium H3SJ34-1]|uniref:hypothetical protein n=1 Tax=Terripilifer ovatus TaxID=3032367 RepID=UPI003AB96170|nr:hypothetical protein [Roseiarcaceae bacterium H3SJ34-1]